jgi:hypothetical protein
MSLDLVFVYLDASPREPPAAVIFLPAIFLSIAVKPQRRRQKNGGQKYFSDVPAES